MQPELLRRPLLEPEIVRTISVATVRGRRHMPVVDLFVRLSRAMAWGPPKGRKAQPPTGSAHAL
jgi:hypothetical protein